MADKGSELPPQINLDAKWDACQELSVRRVFYSSVAGAAAGLLLFRSPVKRWATVAFAAGVGIGSAYADCSHIMSGTYQSRCPIRNRNHKHHQNPAQPSVPEATIAHEE